MLILRVVKNPHGSPEPGISFAVRPTKAHILGRGTSAEIHLSCPGVSREHFRLTPDSGQWYIEDMGSKNGTKLNGGKIRARETVDEGDMIEFASVHLEVTRASLANSAEEADKIGTVYIADLNLDEPKSDFDD